ncbi:MAG TPA: tetratricopeptide repeat protein, partial [Pyrinomonadaceae bacterium]|nr:tetratricopeptide repeat protein [Pyrinomonadaceae bacterium]
MKFNPTRFWFSLALCAVSLAICQAQTKLANNSHAGDAELLVREARKLTSEWSQPSASQALRKYEKARSIYAALGDLQKQAVVLLEIGQAQETFGEPTAALANYESALDFSRRARSPQLEAAALNRLGFYYIDRSQFDKAFDYGLQAKQLSLSSGDRENEARALLLLGMSRYNRRELTEAKDQLGRSLDEFKALGNLSEQAQVLEMLGHVSHELGNAKEALKIFTDALELANQGNDLLTKGKVI